MGNIILVIYTICLYTLPFTFVFSLFKGIERIINIESYVKYCVSASVSLFMIILAIIIPITFYWRTNRNF